MSSFFRYLILLLAFVVGSPLVAVLAIALILLIIGILAGIAAFLVLIVLVAIPVVIGIGPFVSVNDWNEFDRQRKLTQMQTEAVAQKTQQSAR